MLSLFLPAKPRPAFGLVATLFGLLTIGSGARALFLGAEVGDAVGFVLWFNFLAGFAYVAAGVLILRGAPGAFALSLAIALATLAIFAAFGLYVASGNPFEGRTVGAMILRSGFWMLVSAVLWRDLARKA